MYWRPDVSVLIWKKKKKDGDSLDTFRKEYFWWNTGLCKSNTLHTPKVLFSKTITLLAGAEEYADYTSAEN